MLYAFFDGDNIGNTLEILLIEGRISEAVVLSKNVTIAMTELETFLKAKSDVEIIILGGDDILIKYNDVKHNKDFLVEIARIFKDYTGLTMSCGVGGEITESVYNLRLAKLYGKNQIRGAA